MGGEGREKATQTQVDRDEDEYTTDAWAAAGAEGGRRECLRSAAETADFLIVHEGMRSPPEPVEEAADVKLARLRERIDTGAYAVAPFGVAQAMIRCVSEIQGEDSED